MKLLGYTRISTPDQDLTLQYDALTAAGVDARDIFTDTTTGRLMLGILATLAEYEKTHPRTRDRRHQRSQKTRNTTRPTPVNPEDIRHKLDIITAERAKGHTVADAAKLVGWSRSTYYRHLGGHHELQRPNGLAL